MIELAIMASEASSKDKKVTHVMLSDGRTVKFQGYQCISFCDNHTILALCYDEKTNQAFGTSIKNIKAKIYEK